MDGKQSDIAIASAKVAAIVEAAELAAEDLRQKTERRARDRIAEADRAAELRVAAAEEEAREIVQAAREQVAQLTQQAQEAVKGIHASAEQARREADEYRKATLATADAEARKHLEDAERAGIAEKNEARKQARAIVDGARSAAQRVEVEGGDISHNLAALSTSMKRNAERLLNDVRLAHQRLTAELDAALPGPDDSPVPSRRARPAATPAAREAAPTPRAADPAPAQDDIADVLIRAAAAAEAGESLESAARPTPRRRRAPGADDAPGGDFDIPEFVPGRR